VKFFTQRRRLPIVPLVSLIDILAILLIFFIATTTFKKEEEVEPEETLLNISLPKASALSGTPATEERTTISVTKDELVYIGEDESPLAELGETLKQLIADNPDLKLELKADEELPLGVLVKVWDGFNQAGIAIKDVPARILLEKPPENVEEPLN
jgi:biopolymer transport protein ExbD